MTQLTTNYLLAITRDDEVEHRTVGFLPFATAAIGNDLIHLAEDMYDAERKRQGYALSQVSYRLYREMEG